MIWVTDTTGRFPRRPHFEPQELDGECEKIIEEVLQSRHGKILYPVSTDDLLFMLERNAWLDPYADLRADEGKIWGETEFIPGRQPKVRIWRRLSEDERFENPFRTTITHEFSHVHFHGPLFELKRAEPSLSSPPGNNIWVCKREEVEGHRNRDWMEWQAGYCSGHYLCPSAGLND